PVPSQKADLIYTGGLSNTDEALYLFNKECGLEDAVATASPWPAGDNETKRTMERSDNLDWQTSASINGTPKQKNGEAWQGESNSANNNNASNYSGGGSSEEIYSPPQILITEIQIEGSQDFVELYNPTNSAQDLTGSKLRKKTQAGSEYSLYSFSGETSVPAKTYRIWASSKNSYHQEIGSHFSTSAYLTENNSVALLDKNGDSVDKLAWGQDHNNPFLETVAFPSNPETYDPLGEYFSEIGFTGSREPYSSTLYPQSVGRKIENEEYKDTGDNSADFEIQSPTPKNENRTFETKTIEQVLLEIDSTPPTVQITFNPLAETNQQDAKFTFEANEENCIFNCEIDSGGWEECASPKEYNGLSDGEHAFRVEASDIFQNTSDAVSYSWTIDISIESALILLKDKQTASSNFTNNQIVDAEITQDDEAEAWFLAENQSEQPMQEHESWQEQRPSEFELSQDQGEKTVFIWTKDILGNISALGNNTSIVFDDMPPSSVIIGLEQEQSQTTFTIEWSGSDGENGSEIDSYEIQKKEGGNDWAVWYEGSQTSKNFTGNDGITYYFKSRAIDKAGNTEAWPETAETFTYVNVSIPSRPIISNPENRAIISPEQDQNETEDGIQIMVSGTTDTGTNVFVDGNAVDTSPENNWSFEATLATGVNNFNIWCEEVDGDLSEQVIFELTLEPEETGSGEVVINEIAWMGTEASHTDEWIELYNTTGEDIELEGWTLNAEDGSPEITLANTISANGFYLLERTDDNTISDILADWTGAFGNGLHNDGESLELRDNENNLIDKLDCEDEW
nr:lamin tail domain-containing protein [Bacteroidota bacterium]